MKSITKKEIKDEPTEHSISLLYEKIFPFARSEELLKGFSLIDKQFQANLARLTAGVSPAAVQADIISWLCQLGQSPGHLLELTWFPVFHFSEYVNSIFNFNAMKDEEKDIRFSSESWQYFPWYFWVAGFHQLEKWWYEATTEVPGLPKHTEQRVFFFARQILDALSPSNFIWSNPDLYYETIQSGGYNLVRGTELAIEHMVRRYTGSPPPGADNFIPGKDVAITPGKVVFKNRLIELIQYEPQTKTVYKEPILILPAWIMKYYILDLSPHNSFVKWLVQQGHTVFIISWLNPTSKDRDLGMDEYYRLGAMAAIDEVSSICAHAKINLIGYCLGGTLAMLTAAAMAQLEDDRLNTLTLLAAQGDFSEAGELMIFINQSEVSFLKNMMWDQGYLDTKQMAGAFQLLRSYDLIWSKIIQDYMHGRGRGMIDLLAWNADATRMPYKMHSEYLEKLFLHNEFAHGHFSLEGIHIAPENIYLPSFVVSAEKDHVAPWHSVYKVHLMLNGDLVFVLTSGGHNAGIVSEPGHKGRFYRILKQKQGKSYLHPDKWMQKAVKHDGSWWLSLNKWLIKHDSPDRIKPPKLKASGKAAPGNYVLQK